MRRFLSVILLVVAAVIWWAFPGQGSPTGSPRSTDPDGARSLSAGSGEPREAEVTERRTIRPARALRIVGDDDVALQGAELRRYIERDDGTMDLDADALAVSDLDGCLVHPILAKAKQKLVVRFEGHVPVVVVGGFEGEQMVHLERGSRLTVNLITDMGVPLPDAAVVLSAQVLSTLAGLPKVGAGAPLHPRPVWSRVSGPTGEAVLSDLPAGRFFLNVFHPLYAPVISHADLRPLTIDGEVTVTVTMQAMFGVVFECPSPEPVESQTWTWNLAEFDQSYGVVSRLGTCRRELRERFPNAHVFVHRPRFSNQVTRVGCQVVLRDGTFWSGSWPLRPLRELREPVYLEQDVEARYRKVRVELVSKSGRVLDVPLQIAEWMAEYSEKPAVWSVLPGRPVFLKYGRYCAEPQDAAAWWTTSVEQPLFEVSETVPAGDVVRLQIDADFVPVRFVPVYLGDALLSSLHIWIDDPAQRGLVIANWKPERGPIRMLVPAGSLSIRARSAHYEDLDLTVEVGAEDIDRQIELRLIERH